MRQIKISKKAYWILEGSSDLIVPINTALVDLQTKRQSSGKSLCYYARHFCTYLQEKDVADLSEVTAADVRFFTETLIAEGKSASVLEAYAALISEIFDSFLELNGHPHPTLTKGDAEYAAGGRGKKRRKHYTLAGNIIRRKVSMKEKNKAIPIVTYTKWYTPEEVEMVADMLSLRDRCVFLCSVETGYRISSVLSIMANTDDIKNGFVEETFSKTGRLHQAQISAYLQRCLAEYMATERCRVIDKVGQDCGHLFVGQKGKNAGKPLSYNAFYLALKAAEEKIHSAYPDRQDMMLHSHAGRSTYFNTLMHQNLERKQAGEEYLSDSKICHLMDWKTMDCLDAYYNYQERAIPPSPLYEDFMKPSRRNRECPRLLSNM